MEILASLIEDGVIDIRKNKEYMTPTYKLSVVFRYQTDRKRDSKQYKKVISIVQEYDRQVNRLDMSKGNYSGKVQILFDVCLTRLRNIKINRSTMSALIAYAFIQNGGVRDRLLTVLYDQDSETFLSCFKKTTKVPQKDHIA